MKGLKKKKEILKSIREEKAHAYTASGDGLGITHLWTQLGQQEDMFANEVRLLELKLANISIIDPSSIDEAKVQIGSKVKFIMIREKCLPTFQTMYIVGGGESDVKTQKNKL